MNTDKIVLNVYEKNIYELKEEQTFYNTPKYVIYNTVTHKKVFEAKDKDLLINFLLAKVNTLTRIVDKAFDKLERVNNGS